MPKKLAISKDLVLLAAAISFLPVWRCGLRGDLTFWQFVQEHTIWGHDVEYIPEEFYGDAPCDQNGNPIT